MNKSTKTWLITAAALLLGGCLIFAGVMTMLAWNFSELSTDQFETSHHEVKEDFRSISIVTDTADMELIASEELKCEVVCHEQKNGKHSVSVRDGVLIIEVKDTRKWYDHIGIEFIDARKITIYLPDGEYGALAVKGTTGGAKIASDFAFESIAVSFTTGSIKSYSSASGAVKLKTTTGGISIENCYVGSVDVSVSTGSLNAEDLACKSFTANGSTGDIKLKNVIAEEKLSLKGSTGSIKLDSCDASEIFIKTGTGSVTGTLISNKTFIARSNTGAVSIPKDTVGGKCEITTNTGNIKITLK
jgi:DUF4097 and DUF4098 domain-containing protein YvlB